MLVLILNYLLYFINQLLFLTISPCRKYYHVGKMTNRKFGMRMLLPEKSRGALKVCFLIHIDANGTKLVFRTQVIGC